MQRPISPVAPAGQLLTYLASQHGNQGLPAPSVRTFPGAHGAGRGGGPLQQAAEHALDAAGAADVARERRTPLTAVSVGNARRGH